MNFKYQFQNQEYYPTDGLGNAYGYYDLNADGQDELLIAETYIDEAGELEVWAVFGIYTVIHGEPVQIAEGWSRNTYTVYENGLILNIGSNSAFSTDVNVLKLNSAGELEVTDIPTDISGDALGNEVQIAYTQLQYGGST